MRDLQGLYSTSSTALVSLITSSSRKRPFERSFVSIKPRATKAKREVPSNLGNESLELARVERKRDLGGVLERETYPTKTENKLSSKEHSETSRVRGIRVVFERERLHSTELVEFQKTREK